MSLQILDFVLLGIMLISGVLALARGFTREILSLCAWVAAAVAAWFAIQQPQLTTFASQYISNPTVAWVSVALVAFLVTLILASMISVRLSDRVVDSAAGAFDRTLGFIYGLGRGLVFVAICLLFYGWVQPPDKQEDWIKNAQSFPLVQSVGQMIVGFIPPGVRDMLTKSSLAGNPEGAVVPPAAGDAAQPQGYNNGQTQGMDNLVNGASQGQANQP
jgi:membrane protein required for colicin V production